MKTFPVVWMMFSGTVPACFEITDDIPNMGLWKDLLATQRPQKQERCFY